MRKIVFAIDLLPSQKEMWSSIQFSPDASVGYNLGLKIQFDSDLCVYALERAISDLVIRHSILNSIIDLKGESLLFLEKSEIKLEKISLEDTKVEDFEKKIINTPFNLNFGPLVRFIFCEDKQVLFICVHHIICDGWSLEVLTSELSQLYSDRVSGRVSALKNEAPQIYNYETPNSVSELSSFWKNYLNNSPFNISLPLKERRSEIRSFNSSRFNLEIDQSTVAKLRAASASCRVNIIGAFFGLYAIAMSRLSAQKDIIIGMPVAPQASLEESNLIGHFVNLLPIRFDINSDLTFKEILVKTKNDLYDALDNQDISFGEMIKLLNMERVPGEIPLINTIFNVDVQKSDQGMQFIGLESNSTSIDRSFENFEIFTNIVLRGDYALIECQYNPDLLSKDLITDFMKSFLNIIDDFTRDSSSSCFDDNYYQISTENKALSPSNNKAVESLNLTLKPAQEVTVNNLRNIWIDLLISDDIEDNSNFFNLGGHSILAIQMVSQVKNKFNVNINLNDIFIYKSLSSLASFIELKQSQNEVDDFKVIVKDNQSQNLSKTQQRSLFLSLNSDIGINNLPTGLRLGKNIDLKLLEKSIRHFVQCHSVLTSKLIKSDGGFHFEKSGEEFITIEVVSMEIPEIQNYIEEQFRTKLNLFDEHLFKTKIFVTSENEVVLFFMPHHLVWDGWCFDILINEVNQNYKDLKTNGSFTLKEEEYTFTNYIQTIDEYHLSRSYGDSLAFWLDRLKGELPKLELPTDFSRSAETSSLASSVFLNFNDKNLNTLKNISKKLNISMFSLLLGLFKIVLSKYASTEDLIVGLPVRNRFNEKFDRTVGYFVNSICLRSKPEDSKKVSEFLTEVAAGCFEAFSHENVIIEDVMNMLGIKSDSGVNPIFQTFFTYQDVSNRSVDFDGNTLSHVKRKVNTAHTDLDIWIKSDSSKIEGALVFKTDLFEEITIQRIAQSYESLLNSLEDILECNLEQVNVLTDNQIQLLDSWNNTDVKYQKDSFIELFVTQAKLSPDDVAVQCSSHSFTYNEVDKISNSIARHLEKTGVNQGDLVGICLDRSSYMLISLLAILKTGAGYIPLEPSFPDDRLNYMIESSGLQKIILQSNNKNRFDSELVELVLDDLLNEKIDDSPFLIKPRFEDLMYVIYTSGSTGLPKGVELTHRSVSNFLQSMVKKPGMNNETSLLAVTTLSFDIAVLELYAPLIVGGSVFVASKEETINGDQLSSICKKSNINTMQATPSTWRLLLVSEWNPSSSFKVLCGGEPFPKDLAFSLLEKTNDVWNMYGPTETTVWSTCKKITIDDNKILIGKPIDNTSIHILDAKGNTVPIGTTGEMYIGGDGLAKGYRKQEHLTSKVFKFNEKINKLIYNTGDLARFTFDGNIECLGRNDGQVKVRGYRIELGEIEAVISKYDDVDECVVIVREDNPGDSRLVAYIRGQYEKLDQSKLRAFLKESLPAYMVPSNFITLEVFPKTLNNKIDKKKLPSPREALSSTVTDTVVTQAKPKTDFEKRLYNLWCEVLQKDDFGIEDNFFEIGGHSIMSVVLFAKIEKQFDINIELRVLFEMPTIKLLADYISMLSSAAKDKLIKFKSLIKIKEGNGDTPVFLFHGVGGNVLNYRHLAQKAGIERAVYGFQSPGVDGKTSLSLSIKEMAKLYIAEMKSIYTGDNFILAGGSMGGMIAYEVASQLKSAGKKVEKLVMFDTFGPDAKFSNTQKRSLGSLFNSFRYRSRAFYVKLLTNYYDFRNLPYPHTIRYFNIEKNNYKCLREYKYANSDVDLVLFRAPVKVGTAYEDPNLGWGKVVKGSIKTIVMDANHDHFVEADELPTLFAKELSNPETKA